MAALINIAGMNPIDDPDYRYRMPRIQAKVEGRGNGIKTVIVNMKEVRGPARISELSGPLGAQPLSLRSKRNHGLQRMLFLTHNGVTAVSLSGLITAPGACVGTWQVAEHLHREPAEVTKFFGCELGAQTRYSEDTEKSVVNGSHTAQALQKLLAKYIELFVLCPECHLPETSEWSAPGGSPLCGDGWGPGGDGMGF
jgi:hypothetical protein